MLESLLPKVTLCEEKFPAKYKTLLNERLDPVSESLQIPFGYSVPVVCIFSANIEALAYKVPSL